MALKPKITFQNMSKVQFTKKSIGIKQTDAKVLKLNGSMCWLHLDQKSGWDGWINTERVIFRNEKELALDFTLDDQPPKRLYTVNIKIDKDWTFKGTFTRRCQDVVVNGTVNGSLYTNPSQKMSLIGKWLENGEETDWICEFEKVERFEDEAD